MLCLVNARHYSRLQQLKRLTTNVVSRKHCSTLKGNAPAMKAQKTVAGDMQAQS
jgi:hypothetical protein